jgi:hypothetical protein
MFEEQPGAGEFDTAERLEDLLPAITVAPGAQPRAQPEQRGFELPPRIWTAMIACYAVFMTAMATGLGSSGKAMLSIVVAAVYITVYFGTARVVMRQNPAREGSPLDRTGSLGTLYGPMERRAVYGQILIVPVAVALFGIAVSTIIMLLGSSA